MSALQALLFWWSAMKKLFLIPFLVAMLAFANVSSKAASSHPDVLLPGEDLKVNEQITSPNKQYRLVLQGDGNLVLYQGSTSLWASNTVLPNIARVVMQGDGNLVIYTSDGQPAWDCYRSFGHPGARLNLQDDGNLVIYDSTNRPLWDKNAEHMNPASVVDKKQLSKNRFRYKFIGSGEVAVADLTMFLGAGRESITLVNLGPNNVYYHTEGNPPGLGANDNGIISPNKSSQFKISAGLLYSPTVYVSPKFGLTTVDVYFGDIDMKNIPVHFTNP